LAFLRTEMFLMFAVIASAKLEDYELFGICCFFYVCKISQKDVDGFPQNVVKILVSVWFP